jgi:hypothetical protein
VEELEAEREERDEFELATGDLGAMPKPKWQPEHWDYVSPLKTKWDENRRGWVTANIHRRQPDWWTYIVYAASLPMAYWLAGHAVMAPDKDSPGIRQVFNLESGQRIVASYF